MAARIGEFLLKEKLITRAQLEEALAYQKAQGGKLGASLVKLGYVRDQDITALQSRQYGVPSINLAQFAIDPAVIKLIPAEAAIKYQIVPLSHSGTTVTIAMTDPTNVLAMDDIKFMTGYNVEPVVASELAVLEAIRRYYAADRSQSEMTLDLATRAIEALPQIDAEVVKNLESIDIASLERQSSEAPVVRLVNLIFISAIQKGASDIHIEPYEREFRVRYRIDGILHNVMSPPTTFRDAITSRIKIMAQLDIAEKRMRRMAVSR